MPRLLKLLETRKLTLIVSLPRNRAELARAAVDGGADALKVHININHPASGTRFGGFLEEKDNLLGVLQAVKIPVGIVPGEKKLVAEDEMEEICRMGFDFFDINYSAMPAWMLALKKITRVVALDERYTIDKLFGLESQGVEVVEAGVVPPAGYGERLNIGDLQHYITIATSVGVPTIVPTQRAILPDELPVLSDTGVKAIMIGAVVTGKDPRRLEEVTAKFRQAIDRMG